MRGEPIQHSQGGKYSHSHIHIQIHTPTNKTLNVYAYNRAFILFLLFVSNKNTYKVTQSHSHIQKQEFNEPMTERFFLFLFFMCQSATVRVHSHTHTHTHTHTHFKVRSKSYCRFVDASKQNMSETCYLLGLLFLPVGTLWYHFTFLSY